MALAFSFTELPYHLRHRDTLQFFIDIEEACDSVECDVMCSMVEHVDCHDRRFIGADFLSHNG